MSITNQKAPQQNAQDEGLPTVKSPDPSINGLRKTGRRSISSAILSACIFPLVCSAVAVGIAGQNLSSPHSADEIPPVTVAYSALDQATIYSASSGDCYVKWIAYNAGPNQGVVKHSPRCAAPLAEQLPLLIKICAKLFDSDRNAPPFRTLFWGGLIAERKPASHELPLRLALAAYQSPGWDVKKGKPKNGDINGFVRNLANQTPIYPELKDLFRLFHRHITLASVEKVRVMEAEKLPFYDQLKHKGVTASDRLPFDCMAWFSISTLSQESLKIIQLTPKNVLHILAP